MPRLAMHQIDAALIEHAAGLIAGSDALVIAAGAGMGVDSGLPDFRGNEGFWRAYPALGADRRDFAEIASPRTFLCEPELAWGFYGHRLQLYRDTVPHEGFDILKRWAGRLQHGGFVFTSNVDAQFQKAGMPEDHVYECHGALGWLQCTRPCSDAVWPATDLDPVVDVEACRWLGELPACPRCGSLARPNVLMFDDAKWIRRRAQAQEARIRAWLDQVHRPVILEIGAGVHVPSVRMFVQEAQYLYDARLVRINPREPLAPNPFDVGMQTGALTGLRAIDAALAAFWP